MNLPMPPVPTVFLKPATALLDPWPAPSMFPKITQVDNTGDYEAEMAIIIGRDVKNVSEAEAGDYVLGYTAANDVSSRTSQNAQSQWCFSKGFDGSCPLGTIHLCQILSRSSRVYRIANNLLFWTGPAVVSASAVPDPAKLHIRGLRNGEPKQDRGLE
jgi:2-keto-4-pentenoate hydratase/2-oxohepta-3-ene-1,7-dioic acid hydratase in catechol pathway